jgi:glycosyltransferase involved in cell wall biosynthesis
MKIAFLAPFGIRPKGTLQARMLPLAKALQQKGHGVEIIAPPYTNPEDSGLVELFEGVTIRNVMLGPLGNILSAPFIAQRMLATALETKPDLVHLFKPKGFGGLAAMALLFGKQIGLKMPKLVVDSDDREGAGGMNDLHRYSLPEKLLYAFQEKSLTRWADGVTVASRALESLAWGMGAAAGKVRYLPNGPVLRVAGDRHRGRSRFNIPGDLPVLLLYTRFFEFDQQRLYGVLEKVLDRIPDLRILVVGKGMQGEDEQLLQWSIRSGKGRNLVMAGWIEPADLPDCLAAADAAVYPFDDTLVNRTKCPAKLAELAAAGVPLAADRVGQIAEYLQHGESGLLVEPGDTAGLADAVVRLLTEQELALNLGLAAARRMRSEFGWSRLADGLEQFYYQVGSEGRQ